MFFMLSHKMESNSWCQVGIVIADSVLEAVEKIGANVIEMSSPTATGAWAELEDGYYLEEYGEVTSLTDLQRK